MDEASRSLAAQQQLVLQAIHDHFYQHGAWPTFIKIDRPLRRTHGLDTRSVLLSLPDSLIVKPRPGMRIAADDELRLRLPGIEACQGGTEDTDRFVRLLRWLAQKELDFEPEPGSTDTMPQVKSDDVREHLGLEKGDHGALHRLYALLQIDHWGLSGRGSSADGWHVLLSPDIYRFRDVQTVEDCMEVRAQWIAEAEAAVSPMRNAAPGGLFQSFGSEPTTDASNTLNTVVGTSQGQVLQAGVVHGNVYNNSPLPSTQPSVDRAVAQARLMLIDQYPYIYGEGFEIAGKFSVHVGLTCTNHGERPLLDVHFEVWMSNTPVEGPPLASSRERILLSGQRVQFDAKPYVARGEDKLKAWRLHWRDVDGHAWYLDRTTRPDPHPFTGQPPGTAT